MKEEKDENKDYWLNFLDGDDAAYSWIYTTYVQDLYQFGLCFTADVELIKDCIQDLFVHLYSHRKNISLPKSVKSYLFVSLKHNLFHSMSNDKVSLDQKMEEGSIPLLLDNTVEETLITSEVQSEQEHKVETILSVLTPRQKEVIYYRYVQELSISEISEIMGMNYQSTQNLIQRALEKVRKVYPNGLGLLLVFFNVIY